jgi:hypothetical protein
VSDPTDASQTGSSRRWDHPQPGRIARSGATVPDQASGAYRQARSGADEPVSEGPARAPRTPPPPDRPTRDRQLVWAICLVAAVGGALTDVAPAGDQVVDRLLAAGFAALLAAAGSTARRWTWFVAAGAALALADGWVAVAAGGGALVIAFAATRPARPPRFVGALVGGLSAVGLLSGAHVWFHGASALVAAAAATPMLLSAYRRTEGGSRRGLRLAAVLVVGAAVAVVGLYGALLAQSRGDIQRGLEQLDAAMAAARDGDDVRAEELFAESADAFAPVERRLGGWWAAPAEVLPVVGYNARAIHAMAASAADLSQRGEETAAEANVDEITVEGGRLDLERVQGLERPLEDVASSLEQAAARMDAVETAWLVAPVAERVDEVQREVADAQPDARLAADAVRVVPAIFGAGGESRWLVAFTTPVEARGRTGFMGNFAELSAVDGDVEMPRFGRTLELEQGGTPGIERTLSGPEDFLSRWGRFQPRATWRNLTMSPDFPSISQVMTELYPQSGGRPVDGVIAIDAVALAALLEFTGPVEIPGVPEPLTAESAAEFILFDQYVDLPNSERIDVLEKLARTVFDRLTRGELPAPEAVADVLGPAVQGGHLQLYSIHPEQERLFTAIGADGALPAVDGDFLAVVNSNATGNKIDRFLSRDVDYRATWDPASGEVDATLSVTLVNDAPSVGLPGYIIGNAISGEGANLPRGTNRTHLSLYSPLALEAADLDGVPLDLPAEVERDRYAYSLFLDIPPDGGTRVVTARLRGSIPVDGDGYRLDVAGQPLVVPDDLHVTVESAGDRPLRAGSPMQVERGTASASIALTEHETTFSVTETDG